MASSRLACALVGVAVALAALCAIALPLAGLGHRWGWWGYRAGFVILKWAVYAAVLAAALGLAAAVLGLTGRAWAMTLGGVAAMAIAGAALWVPVSMLRAARSVPAIHDITTDTENPPVFVAVLARRRDAANPAEYAGAPIAARQRAAYPDLVPVELALPPGRALAGAAAAARALGWEIVAEAPAEGRLEATDTTPWWGFKDDVVVRVTPSGPGSRVDVRSLSRVGVSDLGANARRIRRFLTELRARAGG